MKNSHVFFLNTDLFGEAPVLPNWSSCSHAWGAPQTVQGSNASCSLLPVFSNTGYSKRKHGHLNDSSSLDSSAILFSILKDTLLHMLISNSISSNPINDAEKQVHCCALSSAASMNSIQQPELSFANVNSTTSLTCSTNQTVYHSQNGNLPALHLVQLFLTLSKLQTLCWPLINKNILFCLFFSDLSHVQFLCIQLFYFNLFKKMINLLILMCLGALPICI